MRDGVPVIPGERAGTLLDLLGGDAEQWWVLEHASRHVLCVVCCDVRGEDAARRMSGDNVVAIEDLLGKRDDCVAVRLARVKLWFVVRLAVSEAVDGDHVVALRKLRQDACVVLPFHALTVYEHQGRTVVGAFAVADGCPVDGRLLLLEARSVRGVDDALLGMEVVVAIDEDSGDRSHDCHGQTDTDHLEDFRASSSTHGMLPNSSLWMISHYTYAYHRGKNHGAARIGECSKETVRCL